MKRIEYRFRGDCPMKGDKIGWIWWETGMGVIGREGEKER